MSITPARGEIWLADLGIAAKTRPILIVSTGYDDQERALVSYVPRTTTIWGTRHEVPHQGRGFETGAFNVQNIGSVPAVRLLRRLGVVDGPTLARVDDALRAWLGLT